MNIDVRKFIRSGSPAPGGGAYKEINPIDFIKSGPKITQIGEKPTPETFGKPVTYPSGLTVFPRETPAEQAKKDFLSNEIKPANKPSIFSLDLKNRTPQVRTSTPSMIMPRIKPATGEVLRAPVGAGLSGIEKQQAEKTIGISITKEAVQNKAFKEDIKKNFSADNGLFGVIAHNFLPTRIISEPGDQPYKNQMIREALDEYSQEHPVKAGIGKVIAGAANVILVGRLGGGFGLAEKTESAAGGLRNLYPTGTRILGKALETGSIFGLNDFMQALLDQRQKGRIDIADLAKKTGRGALWGTIAGAGGSLPTLPQRVVGSAALAGALSTVESLLNDGKISKQELQQIAVDAGIFSLFELFGGRGKTDAFQAKKMENLAEDMMVNKIQTTNPGVSEKEAKETIKLLHELEKISLLGKAGEREQQRLVQILDQIPDSFQKVSPEYQTEYVGKIIDKVNNEYKTIADAVVETPFTPPPQEIKKEEEKSVATTPEETKIPEEYKEKSKNIAELFNKSEGQKPVATFNGERFSLGDWGIKHQQRKTEENKGDRFSSDELPETISNIKAVFRASDKKDEYRYDNLAWVAELPNKETRVIYTRKNKKGEEEIISWHKLPKTKKAKYLENLASFGVPSGTRTHIKGLEGPQFFRLAYGNNLSISQDKENVKQEKAKELVKVSEEAAKILKPKAVITKFNKTGDSNLITKQGEYTNKYWLLKPEFIPAKLKERMDKNITSLADKPDSKQIWDRAKKGELMTIPKDVYGYGDFGQGPVYLFKLKNGKKIGLNKAYYDYLKKNIKDFNLKTRGIENPAIIYSGKKEVGMLMPTRGVEEKEITKIKPVDKTGKISYAKNEKNKPEKYEGKDNQKIRQPGREVLPESEKVIQGEPGISNPKPREYERKGTGHKPGNVLHKSGDRSSIEREKLLAYNGKAGEKGATGVGVLDNYFTPLPVIERVWKILNTLDLPKNPKVLEPAAGIGKFFEFALPGSKLVAYEIDKDNAEKLKALYPNAEVKNEPFEDLFIDKRGNKKEFKADFDLVIGNPPYGTHRQFYKNLGEEPTMANYQEYFIKRGLNVLKDGGYLAYVMPSSFMRSKDDHGKMQIGNVSELVYAFRLPNGVFKNTNVGTDIVIFRKSSAPDMQKSFREIINDNYFKENRDNILGTPTTVKGRFGPEEGVAGSIGEAMYKIDKKIPKTGEVKLKKEFLESKPQGKESIVKKSGPAKKPFLEGKETKGMVAKKMPIPKGKKMIHVSNVDSDTAILAKHTKVDGSIDKNELPEKLREKLNYMAGKYYSDFNYYQGDVYKKLDQLEKDKKELSKEQYKKQKAGLEKIKPKPLTVKDIYISPNDEDIMKNDKELFELSDKAGENGNLGMLFDSYLSDLDSDAFGASSLWEVRGFIRGNRVNEMDKKRNAIVKTRRREAANRLFKKFIETELDEKSTKKLEDYYNYRFNAYVEPNNKDNAVILTKVADTFNNDKLKIRDYQYEAINFLVNKGVGVLAHEVGAGKTLEGIIAIREIMERGWAKRPLIVVPNRSVYNSWKSTIHELFPDQQIIELHNLGADYAGNIIKLSKEKANLKSELDGKPSDSEREAIEARLKEVESKMKLPEKSIALATYTGLNKIGLSLENTEKIAAGVADTLGSGVNQTARKKAIEAQTAEGLKGKASKNVEVEIEDLGVDHITVDEHHNYKNLFSNAKARKPGQASEYAAIRGGSSSQRAVKLYYLTQYILQNNNMRNVFGLTATPFTNSPLEIYNMLSYVGEFRLRERGIKNLHDFMTMFMDIQNKPVMTSSTANPIKFQDVVEKFKNIKSLQEMVRELFHFKSSEDLGLKRPNKKRTPITIEENSLQKDYRDRAQELWNKKEAGALRAIGEMRKISLSPYLSMYHKASMPSYKEVIENSPKLKYVMDAIGESKKHSQGKTAGQIIYIPQGLELIPYMQEYLVKELKYKKDQVDTMTAKTMNNAERAQKKIDNFNDGKTKIVIGSSSILEGVNLQKNTTDMYHLWLPWNPTDMMQIEGRLWRFGNQWENVRMHYPLLTNSGDIKLFQLLETKGKRLQNIWDYTGKNVIDVSDIDPEELKTDLITDPVIALEVEKTFETKTLEAKLDAAKGEKGMLAGRIGKYFETKDKLNELKQDAEQEIKEDGKISYYTNSRIESAKEKLKELSERIPGKNIKEVEQRIAKISEKIKNLEKEIEEVDDKYKAKLEQIKKNPPKKVNQDETKKALEKLKQENEQGFFTKVKKEKKEFLSGGGGGKSGLIYPKTNKATRKAFAGENASSYMADRLWSVKKEMEPTTEKRINKTQIMSWAEKTFGVPVRGKVTHKWKNAGVYYHKKWLVRLKKWGELPVLVHEIAHHIDLTMLSNGGPRIWRKGPPGEVRAIQTELADLDYDQRPGTGRRTKEGFAEYLRHRLTTGKAADLAPVFDKFFNNFLKDNPSLARKLDTFKEKLDIWHNQGSLERVINQIDWKGEHTKKGIKGKLASYWQKTLTRMNDEFYVPKQIVRKIESITGERLRPTKNPAAMMEYSKSKAGAVAHTFVTEKAIDEYGNVLGPGLQEILKPIPKKEMTTFIAYAVSKRAINLEKRGIESGFDIDDAKFIVDKYQSNLYDDVVKNLTEWSNHLLDWVVRAGGLDESTANLMRDLNPIYVPFKRAFIDEGGVITGIGGIFDKGKAVKAIMGSGRPVVNPIEAMIAQTTELIAKAQKIRIARLFAELATQKGVGGFITEVPAPMKATKFSANQIKDYLNGIASARGEGVAISSNDYDDILTVFTQDTAYNGKENIVSVWVDGKQKFYELHPDLYEAMKGIDPLKLGPVAKIMAPYARMLRLGATGLKVSFGLVRNPFRDAFTYAVFSKRNKVTIFDPVAGIYKSLSRKTGTPTWRFRKTGGALSGMIGYDRAAVQQTYDEMLLENLGKKGKTLKIVKHPVNALRDILSITELGPRSVELEQNYKRYIKEHPDWTEEDAFVQAFNDAQDVTINFTKSGKWAKQINEITAFFNVAIRGPEKLYRTFRDRPIQTFIKGLVWLTLIALGSWYKNKDKRWYKNLPPAYKYNNLFFEIGDTVYRLPIPFELGMIFMAAPQAALDTAREKDLQYLEGVLKIAKSQVPNPTPSAFGPLLDVATNKNYLGVPIESEGMKYLYPTERKRDYDRKMSVALSKGADKIGIQLSPIQIDYLLDNYSGGFLRQFKFSSKELADLPIISDLVLRTPEKPARQLNQYFADYEVLAQKKQSKIATPLELTKYYKIQSFYKLYGIMQKAIREAEKRKDYKQRDELYKKMSTILSSYGYN